MNAKPVRFGLVGCGAVSKKHIMALSAIDGAKIAAVCDLDPDAARSVAERTGATAFDDPYALCAEVEPDIISVLTPTGDHVATASALAAFGKPLIVEKPLALSRADADRIIDACDAYGTPLFVVKQNRFNPPVQALKAAIDAGRFGKLVMGSVRVWWSRDQAYYDAADWRGTRALDGGVLANQAAHHIDMLIWMMGEPARVSATLATRLAKIDAEDTAAVTVTFKSGAIGVVEATTGVRPRDIEGSISVLGEGGSVEIGGYFMNELKRWDFATPAPGDDDIFETHGRVPEVPAWNLREYLLDVIESVNTGRAGMVDGREARKTTDLIEVIWEAGANGKTICL